MKNMKKRIAAMLLALACLPVTGMRVQAVDLPYVWGNTTWEPFAGMEPVNDRGFSRILAKGEGFGDVPGLIYIDENSTYYLYLVIPREHSISFTLRDSVDPDENAGEIAAILDRFFPGMLAAYEADPKNLKITDNDGNALVNVWHSFGNPNEFHVWVKDLPENAQEIESELLLALAGQHLISAYYGWGETADYMCGGFDEALAYYNYYVVYDGNEPTRIPVDIEAVQAYLDIQHPGYKVGKGKEGEIILREAGGLAYSGAFHIVPDKELSLREKAELAFELWEQFSLAPRVGLMESAASDPLTGRNAPESPGDVTLDCELSLLDAIALNKNLLGMESLCDTALKNADADGNGTADASDSLAILRELVGLTEGFQEKQA